MAKPKQVEEQIDETEDFSDLISDDFQEEIPEEQEQEQEQESEDEADAEVEAEAEPAEESSDDESDAPVTFKYRGKEYTLDDLKADKDLRTKVLTGAQQQSHYQELYEEKRRNEQQMAQRIQALEAAMQQAQQPRQPQQPQQPQITPQMLKTAYEPSMDSMIQDGWLEEDVKDMYPNTISGVLFLRDQLLSRIGQLESIVAGLANHTQTREAVSARQTTWQRIHDNFDRAAQAGGMFAPLADPATRQDFLTYLENTVNPEISSLVSERGVELIQALWAGKNRDAYLRAVAENKQKTAEQQARRQKAAMAAGEGSGRRSSGNRVIANPLEGTGFEDLV